MPVVGQLVDQAVQPAPSTFVEQPVALHFPAGHTTVPDGHVMHVLVAKPHEPEEHTHPEKSLDDVEPETQLLAHADLMPPDTAIAVDWKVPLAHAVQVMSAEMEPAAE